MKVPDKIWINTDTLNGYYMSNHPLYGEEYLRKNALMNYFHKRVEELNSPLNGVFGSTEREHCNERISELLLLIDKLNAM